MKPHTALLCATTSLAALLISSSSLAQQSNSAPNCDWTSPASGQGAWRFALENDLFSQTDRYYTNGFKLIWVSPNVEINALREPCDKMSVRTAANWIYDVVRDKEVASRNAMWAIGQDMYTPRDRRRTTVDPLDRPYAGWLYVALGMNGREVRSNDTEILHSIEFNIGMVGPAALGQQFQDAIHNARGLERFQGWDQQLKNELGIKLSYERKHRHAALRHIDGYYDVVTHWGATVGNVATYVNVGAEFRLGVNVPDDFGTSPIRPGGNSSAPPSTDEKNRKRDGIHAFASVNARAVARDIFLDGNTWRSSHRIDRKRGVVDVAYGVSGFRGRWTWSYFKVARSQEFIGQVGSQRFGGLIVGYTQ
jgi:lipid A 3-O-deacylase